MEATFIQTGKSNKFVPSAFVPAGTVVVLNNLIGVTKHDIHPGHVGAIALEGIYAVVKAGVAFETGDYVWWDNTAKQATNTAIGNQYLGMAVNNAGIADATIEVRLESSPPSSTTEEESNLEESVTPDTSPSDPVPDSDPDTTPDE